MSQRRMCVAGNWKMHGDLKMAAHLAAQVAQVSVASVDVVICPGYLHLQTAAAALQSSAVELGAQNLAAWPDFGAYTGEISGRMLAELSCRYVIVGHSERRSLLAESNETVAVKVERAQEAGLVPIICVGESLAEREDGLTNQVVQTQLLAIIERCGVASLEQAILAYEPVWAIGTGRTASPEQAQQVHEFLRGVIAEKDAKIAGSVRILYGGSVKPENAAELFAQTDIDGGLIGGAALDADAFLAICQAADSGAVITD